MRDPYEVLGLAKTASAGEIKATFRKLAKKYHPDQSKEPRAKDRFAEIGSAYEILGDSKKRGAYDRGEIDAEGKPRAPQFEGFGFGRRAGAHPGEGADFRNFHFDFGGGDFAPGRDAGSIDPDIISELFGGRAGGRGRGPARGEDVAASVTVPLAMAVGGGSVRVALPTGKTLDVAVPAGVEDGKAIRLRGQGRPGTKTGPAGDAIVTIRYAPHPLFKVEGRDLRLDLPITLYEAVLGGKVRVPDPCRRSRNGDRAGHRRRTRAAVARQGPAGHQRTAAGRSVGDAARRVAGRRGCGFGGADAALARRKTLRSQVRDDRLRRRRRQSRAGFPAPTRIARRFPGGSSPTRKASYREEAEPERRRVRSLGLRRYV